MQEKTALEYRRYKLFIIAIYKFTFFCYADAQL